MEEIISRLEDRRTVSAAKMLLGSKGYKVVKNDRIRTNRNVKLAESKKTSRKFIF